MFKFKKILSSVLAVGIMASMNTSVFASESSSLYVETTVAPENVTEYVEDEGGRLILSLCDEYSLSINDFSIGTPFEVFGRENTGVDLYMYPVLQDNNFEYILYIYVEKDGNIVPSISDHLVSEIKLYAESSSQNDPLMLFANNENLFIANNEGSSLLFQYSDDIQTRNVITPYVESDNIEVVDVLKDSNIDLILPSNSQDTYSTKSPSYSYITLSRTEQQGNQQWCSAFAGAAIIRTLNDDSTKAIDIMTAINGSNPSIDDGISHSELIDYAEGEGLSPRRKSGTLTSSSVRSYIVDDNPIYLSCYGGGTQSSKTRHALVLRGYSDNSGTYSIWNPWDKGTYYSMDMSDKTHYHPGGSNWTWDDTIYSW